MTDLLTTGKGISHQAIRTTRTAHLPLGGIRARGRRNDVTPLIAIDFDAFDAGDTRVR